MWPDRVSNPGPLTYEYVPYRLRYAARRTFQSASLGQLNLLCSRITFLWTQNVWQEEGCMLLTAIFILPNVFFFVFFQAFWL